jgi:hypothetical protein
MNLWLPSIRTSCEIQGVHGDEDSSHGLMGCDTILMKMRASDSVMMESYHVTTWCRNPEDRDVKTNCPRPPYRTRIPYTGSPYKFSASLCSLISYIPSLINTIYTLRFGGTALSLGVKRPGRQAEHSPPYSAKVKEWVELYLHSPHTPSWRCA